MDIAGVSSSAVSSSVNSTDPRDAPSVAAAKTALDVQKAQGQAMVELVEAVPSPKEVDPGSSMGQNIDVYA